jgi:hypothetical protein
VRIEATPVVPPVHSGKTCLNWRSKLLLPVATLRNAAFVALWCPRETKDYCSTLEDSKLVFELVGTVTIGRPSCDSTGRRDDDS